MKFGQTILAFGLLLPVSAMAAVQTVTPSSTAVSPGAGQAFDLTLAYTADNLELSGFGIKMYFDSKKITLTGLTSVYESGKLGAEAVATADDKDGDGDASTDKVINAAWFSVGGKWPGAEKPSIDLYTAQFLAAANFTGSTKINFVGEPAVNSTVNVKSVTVSDSANSGGTGDAGAGTSVAGDSGAGTSVAGDSGSVAPPKKKKGGSLSWLFLLPLALLGLARKRIV